MYFVDFINVEAGGVTSLILLTWMEAGGWRPDDLIRCTNSGRVVEKKTILETKQNN